MIEECSDGWRRVRVPGLAEREQAESLRQALAARSLGAIVVEE